MQFRGRADREQYKQYIMKWVGQSVWMRGGTHASESELLQRSMNMSQSSASSSSGSAEMAGGRSSCDCSCLAGSTSWEGSRHHMLAAGCLA
jgi:hypothetical protein